jgi:hypothetical protein
MSHRIGYIGRCNTKKLHRLYAMEKRLTIRYTDKKENKIFLIFKEIQKGAVAKSYMTNGLLIND